MESADVTLPCRLRCSLEHFLLSTGSEDIEIGCPSASAQNANVTITATRVLLKTRCAILQFSMLQILTLGYLNYLFAYLDQTGFMYDEREV